MRNYFMDAQHGTPSVESTWRRGETSWRSRGVHTSMSTEHGSGMSVRTRAHEASKLPRSIKIIFYIVMW